MANFSHDVSLLGDVHLVHVRGELDMEAAREFSDWLVEVAGSTVIVDLAELSFMDSSGLKAFVVARDRIEAAGDSLVLTKPQPNVLRIFEITGLTDILSPGDN